MFILEKSKTEVEAFFSISVNKLHQILQKIELARISHQQSFSQVETPGMKL
ncbi:MAG: hypothetical protein ACI8ZB_000242 [Desulforhopalus sp.]|jgi:hypothetical protein